MNTLETWRIPPLVLPSILMFTQMRKYIHIYKRKFICNLP
jgi:hypothetical protein